jgi:hypothetical protein
LSDSGVATKLRPWLFAFGIASVGVGLILLWTASAGWILVVTGALELVVAVLSPSMKEGNKGLRFAISVGFLVLAAFLVRSAADAEPGRTGMIAIGVVGAVASVLVGGLGIAKTFADRRRGAD